MCGNIFFRRLSENSTIPIRSSPFAAGLDLFSARDLIIPGRDRGLVETDLEVELPLGTYGRIAPRSGLALNHGIDVGAGVIDADYRGSIKVLLFNHSDLNFEVRKGDRIAQLICVEICYPTVREILGSLSQTARGNNGFGSSGI